MVTSNSVSSMTWIGQYTSSGGYLSECEVKSSRLSDDKTSERRVRRSLDCDFERVWRGWEGGAGDIEFAVDATAQDGECLNAERPKCGRTKNEGYVELCGRRGTRGCVHLHIID